MTAPLAQTITERGTLYNSANNSAPQKFSNPPLLIGTMAIKTIEVIQESLPQLDKDNLADTPTQVYESMLKISRRKLFHIDKQASEKRLDLLKKNQNVAKASTHKAGNAESNNDRHITRTARAPQTNTTHQK